MTSKRKERQLDNENNKKWVKVHVLDMDSFEIIEMELEEEHLKAMEQAEEEAKLRSEAAEAEDREIVYHAIQRAKWEEEQERIRWIDEQAKSYIEDDSFYMSINDEDLAAMDKISDETEASFEDARMEECINYRYDKD